MSVDGGKRPLIGTCPKCGAKEVARAYWRDYKLTEAELITSSPMVMIYHCSKHPTHTMTRKYWNQLKTHVREVKAHYRRIR